MDALIIAKNDLAFDTPDIPINRSGGTGDIFVGYHVTAGQVAVKRVRLSSEADKDKDLVRVGHPMYPYE